MADTAPALPLAGRIALVTGASRGLGRAVAIELARAGAHLVITARSQGGLEETDDLIRAAGGQATLLPLDLENGEALDALGPSLFERFRRLDILVHCAASLGRLTPAPHILPKDWADVVAVNLASTWRLIRSCGPLLAIAEAGRAVFVTDDPAATPRAYWGAYGATKAGAANLVRAWAAEIEGGRLRVELFNPGPMATRLRAAAMPGEDPKTLPRPETIAPRLVALCLA
ncbi:MAG: SDR family NAD(P)-dependent oxidoreductase [Acidibrevibacterium sp.]|jgi:NAD(P)-dependent dehydrogenase (short-subunit alcohol dehydrogenase family)|uniref:SDR family NAD(P)-dependent oxidoreductase n=1 Tax=Acidibrevibacterium fodinaquatile TaxID=1969806 RepID=UPI0023A803DA|nr:SDR family NAD(P)-dependent oxidoreductase [Acidibrevibacterium fodinaquatile]MCA7117897.1 SDR family NAD(P)-dependent oxidoreductase [Acidibrevibacterium fodinaquatile]